MEFYEQTLLNLRKIAVDRHLTQSAMAAGMKVSPSMYSRILKGDVTLTIANVAELATFLHMSEIDIFTYPQHMVPSASLDESVDAVLQIKLNKSNKDKIMSLLFEEGTIESLNNI